MFAAITNGQLAKRKFIYYKRFNIGEMFLRVLWEESFISGYKIDDADNRRFIIYLRYNRLGVPIIKSLKTISTPSNKFSLSKRQIWKIDSSRALIIFSTNKGLQSINSCKKLGIGGIPFIVIQ